MKAPMPAPRRRYQNRPLKVSTAAIDALLIFSLKGARGATCASRLAEQQDESIVGNVIQGKRWVFKAVASEFVAAAQQEASKFIRGLTCLSIPSFASSAAIARSEEHT